MDEPRTDSEFPRSEIKDALIGVIEAISQTHQPRDGKKLQIARNVVVGKTTGMLTTGALYGLVSTFGTAGTGTAIGGLSGAAAHSATMAWIGGLFGGGMATGGVMLPVIGLLAGFLAVKWFRQKQTEPVRSFESFKPFELEIVYCALQLLDPITKWEKRTHAKPLTYDEVLPYVHEGLVPLIQKIDAHLPKAEGAETENDLSLSETLPLRYIAELRICRYKLAKVADAFHIPLTAPKDGSKSFNLRQIVSTIFGERKPKKAQKSLASIAVAATFQDLLSGIPKKLSREQKLVLNALRSTDPSFKTMKKKELEAHLQGLKKKKDLLAATVRATTRAFASEIIKRGSANAGSADQKTIEVKAADPNFDIEYITKGGSIKVLNLRELDSASDLSEQLAKSPTAKLELTEEMVTVVCAIDKPKIQSAIFNQPLFEWARAQEENGLISQVSDELIESSLILSGFVVSECLRSADQKLNYREILENAATGFTASRLTDGAVEFLTN